MTFSRQLGKIKHGLESQVLKELLLILLGVHVKYDCPGEGKTSWYTTE